MWRWGRGRGGGDVKVGGGEEGAEEREGGEWKGG